jgi:hypothetical protein
LISNFINRKSNVTNFQNCLKCYAHSFLFYLFGGKFAQMMNESPISSDF